MTIQYFAYGSNMLTQRLQRRCPSAIPKGTAAAPNCKFEFSKRSIDGSGKGNITADFGDQVFGVIFDLLESELPELDRLEGCGKGYDRRDLLVVPLGEGNEPTLVVTYIADAAHTDPTLRPYDWYLRLVRAGAQQHQLPPRYISQIEATQFLEDPLPDRPERREALLLLQGLR